jgi:hypothetical protein
MKLDMNCKIQEYIVSKMGTKNGYQKWVPKMGTENGYQK